MRLAWARPSSLRLRWVAHSVEPEARRIPGAARRLGMAHEDDVPGHSQQRPGILCRPDRRQSATQDERCGKRCQDHFAGAPHRRPLAKSVAVLGQDRQREELDALLAQRLRFLAGCLAVDAARRRLLVVDLARLLREARAYVLRLGLDLGPAACAWRSPARRARPGDGFPSVPAPDRPPGSARVLSRTRLRLLPLAMLGAISAFSHLGRCRIGDR